jgi:cytochrome P450
VRALLNAQERHGNCFAMTLPPIGRFVVLADPDATAALLTHRAGAPSAGEPNSQLLPYLGTNTVLRADGGTHLRRRRRLLAAFHGAGLAARREAIEQIANRQLDGWPTQAPFALLPRMRSLAFAVIVLAVLGRDDARLDAEARAQAAPGVQRPGTRRPVAAAASEQATRAAAVRDHRVRARGA